MILTCPNCATRYSLPDTQVGPAGRKVKCAQCGEVWRETVRDPEAEAASAPQADLEAAATAASEAAEAAEAAEAEAIARRAAILRDKKENAQRRARQSAAVSAAVWAGLVVAVALTLGLSLVFRETVVKLAPGTATAYAAIGLPVNSAGLLIEGVKAVPSIVGGRRAVMVTGRLRNVAPGPAPAPAFRVDLLDGGGRALDHRIVPIQASPLTRGETRPFSLTIADPPSSAQDVDVTFAPVAVSPVAARPSAAGGAAEAR